MVLDSDEIEKSQSGETVRREQQKAGERTGGSEQRRSPCCLHTESSGDVSEDRISLLPALLECLENDEETKVQHPNPHLLCIPRPLESRCCVCLFP